VDDQNPWALILAHLAPEIGAEDFRRWFSVTEYATDSGDQLSIWVPSHAHRSHLMVHYHDAILRAAAAVGRGDVLQVRYLVAGDEEDEEDE
jgi:chromosomal replication initiation ATPase DnaA